MTDVKGEVPGTGGGIPAIPPPTPGYWPGIGDETRADLTSMDVAAGRLKAEVQERLAPAADRAAEAMYILPPTPHDAFAELLAFQESQFAAQEVALRNVQTYVQGAWAFGVAVEQISKQYADADAFATARLRDVESAFNRLGVQVQSYDPKGLL
ncbi:hypothetical protein [Actinoplanes utahensis]|uniref:PE domain-containing protein n=1 Tax=Actinoplanes utahensis TaxID=1869 RepID=A0A0A6UG27_ACTUT|nr:hypothetical protein [Actinoplanes utahensis]KHD75005.1 hypothetical protein MB27_25670 [Actinoplanes utahensis]